MNAAPMPSAMWTPKSRIAGTSETRLAPKAAMVVSVVSSSAVPTSRTEMRSARSGPW